MIQLNRRSIGLWLGRQRVWMNVPPARSSRGGYPPNLSVMHAPCSSSLFHLTWPTPAAKHIVVPDWRPCQRLRHGDPVGLDTARSAASAPLATDPAPPRLGCPGVTALLRQDGGEVLTHRLEAAKWRIH